LNFELRTPVRWGVIGAGDIVRKRVARALRESQRSELVAISRARADLAEAFAREVGARRWHARWQALINDAEIDAVYVATPVNLHAEQTIAAAEHGKHVLCEKPMAMNVAECDRMIAACRANGVTLGIAYYRRFYPVVARVRSILASGEIGQPVFAQMNAFERFNPEPDHPRQWLLNRAIAGGGPMMDFGCHRIEVLLHLFGPAARSTSLTANVVFDRDVEDTAALLMQFERHGPCASIVVTHAAAEPQDTLQVFATRGSLRCDNLNAGTLRVQVDSVDRVESCPPSENVHQPLVDDFVAAVHARRDAAVDGSMGRAVTAIEDAVYAVGSRATP
jgi:predicted dehydrogenase